MLNNAAPAVDVEMQQFQDDLLQSVREYKAIKSTLSQINKTVPMTETTKPTLPDHLSTDSLNL